MNVLVILHFSTLNYDVRLEAQHLYSEEGRTEHQFFFWLYFLLLSLGLTQCVFIRIFPAILYCLTFHFLFFSHIDTSQRGPIDNPMRPK